MALTERTRVREILFVQDDNSLAWHCHQQPITEIVDGDGKVVSAQYVGAQPLSVEGAGEVLNTALIAITNHRDSLQALLTEAQNNLTAANARIAELEAE